MATFSSYEQSGGSMANSQPEAIGCSAHKTPSWIQKQNTLWITLFKFTYTRLKMLQSSQKKVQKKVQCQFIIKRSEEGSLLHSEGSGGWISIADNFSLLKVYFANIVYLYTCILLVYLPIIYLAGVCLQISGGLFNVWFSAVSALLGKHIKFYSWSRLPDNLTFLTFPFTSTLLALLYLTFLPLFDANAPVGEQGSSWRTQFQGN